MNRSKVLVLFSSVLISRSRRSPDVGFFSTQRLAQVQVEVEVGRGVVTVGVRRRLIVGVIVASHDCFELKIRPRRRE
jgi:hypothetical protein